MIPERKICRICGRPFTGKPTDTLCSFCSRNKPAVVRPTEKNQNKSDVISEKTRRNMEKKYGNLKNLVHPCAKCGTKITVGMYCPDCLAVLRSDAKAQGERNEYKKRMEEALKAEIRADNVILVVDCDEIDLDTTTHILERHFQNHKVSGANNEMRAMSVLRGLKVKLILLDDAIARNYDGFKTLKEIREDPVCKNTKIIMTTTEAKKENIARGLLLGVMAYISKPLDPKNLVKRVNEVLESDANTLLKHKKAKILLIDDDQLELEIEKSSLASNFSCDVLTASNGIEGLWVLGSNEINLILISLDMDFMDGLQVLDFIRNDKGLMKLPIIFMTSSKDNSKIRDIPQRMVRGYVSKPNFKDEDLLLIRTALNESRGIR